MIFEQDASLGNKKEISASVLIDWLPRFSYIRREIYAPGNGLERLFISFDVSRIVDVGGAGDDVGSCEPTTFTQPSSCTRSSSNSWICKCGDMDPLIPIKYLTQITCLTGKDKYGRQTSYLIDVTK